MKTVIEMAREAGFSSAVGKHIALDADLERFAELVRADEREACAKLMDEMAAQDKRSNYYQVAANAIRARGNA